MQPCPTTVWSTCIECNLVSVAIQVIVEQGSSGLSGGAIGGIVGGVVGGSAILACIIAFFLWRRRKQRRARRYSPENMEKIQGKYGANGIHRHPPSKFSRLDSCHDSQSI